MQKYKITQAALKRLGWAKTSYMARTWSFTLLENPCKVHILVNFNLSNQPHVILSMQDGFCLIVHELPHITNLSQLNLFVVLVTGKGMEDAGVIV